MRKIRKNKKKGSLLICFSKKINLIKNKLGNIIHAVSKVTLYCIIWQIQVVIKIKDQ